MLRGIFQIVFQMSIMQFSAKRRKVAPKDDAASSQPAPVNAST